MLVANGNQDYSNGLRKIRVGLCLDKRLSSRDLTAIAPQKSRKDLRNA